MPVSLTPVPLRKLKSQMALKDLSLKDVSELSGVPYANCSQILNGRLIHPEYFRKIREAIRNAPLPLEVIA